MDYKYEYISCNICGSSEYELISQRGQFNLPLNVVLCKKCGLGYLNPRWDESSYLDFYKYEYDKYYRPDFKNSNHKENPIISRLKRHELLPENVKAILDIGSGAGQNLLDLQELYPSSLAYAIEPSLEAQNRLKKNGINILEENVSANWHNECSNKFDIIIMRHVLEHFLDPKKILSKVRSVLSENGLLYLAVPNCLAPQTPLQSHWFRVVHTYYFNKFSIRNISSLNNLEILDLVEGDELNKGEIYSYLKKSKRELAPTFKKEHYRIQRNVFRKRLKKENSLNYKFIQKIKSFIKKAVKVLKKFY